MENPPSGSPNSTGRLIEVASFVTPSSLSLVVVVFGLTGSEPLAHYTNDFARETLYQFNYQLRLQGWVIWVEGLVWWVGLQ